ncbi:MAG: glycosyltransferase family protein [Vicinamibacteraceae bacterium]
MNAIPVLNRANRAATGSVCEQRYNEMTTRPARIALYSHDTMGLGHVRRNILLAQSLRAWSLKAVSLVIAGAREAAAFTMPPGVDCLTLPALSKGGNGRYGTRHMPIALQELVTLRAGAIQAALEAFQPDVFIVDNVPRGALRELDPTLRALSVTGRTRVVLGLRDLIDEPSVVRTEWRRAANEQAIRDYYDAIWVYGDARICDPRVEYGFGSEISARVQFAGYLDQRARLAFADDGEHTLLDRLALPPGRLVVGLVGGGQDGARLADAFTRAALPSDTNAVLVTGPFMPTGMRRDIGRRAADNSRLRVLEFVHEPAALLARADRVVAMGGYGTTCEILSFEKHALIVPRVKPRREQAIRAERLAALGLVYTLDPRSVTPDNISAWLAKDLGAPPPARAALDFGGLRRVPELLQALLDGGAPVPCSTFRRTGHALA